MAAAALFAFIILTGAVWVVTLRNLFRAALSLGLVLLGVAAVFLILEAEFLAFAHILIYVGAILTLIIFTVMLTAKLQTDVTAAAGRQQGPAVIAAGAVFALLTWATWRVPWPTTPPDNTVTLPALGQRLVTTLVLPFEVVSLVFVAVIVGAVAVAAPRRNQQAP